MTSYEFERALVFMAEQIIKTFGKDFGFEVKEPKQEPAEPLIKDEKIRKAVRAWAEANDFVRVFYEYDYSNDVARFIVGETVMIIESDELLKDCRNYTIAELCGEEEE